MKRGSAVPRKCTTCQHDNRLQIDRDLVSGKSMAGIARENDLAYHCIEYHKKNCLSRQMLKYAETREIAFAETIVKDISSVYQRVMDILDRAERKNKSYLFLEAAKELRAYSEFLIRLEQTFRKFQEEEESKVQYSEDAVIIDVSNLDEFTLKKLMRLLAEAKGEGGAPIAAAPVRDTLH